MNPDCRISYESYCLHGYDVDLVGKKGGSYVAALAEIELDNGVSPFVTNNFFTKLKGTSSHLASTIRHKIRLFYRTELFIYNSS